MSILFDNVVFRSIYCFLADSQEICGVATTNNVNWFAFGVAGFIVGFIVVNVVLMATLALIWAERRLLARFQNRSGPNRWGYAGVLTPVADAVKIMFKEDVIPLEADKLLFIAAPIAAMASALAVFAVIPFGSSLFVADVPIGILFVLGITSFSSLAVLTAGWASSNRISIFSSIRAIAVLVSYEIPLALSLVGVIMISGTFSARGIVEAQDVPFILVQPLSFLVFMIASLAEINRTPFDLTEAESELGAGHLNDYSSMKFGLMFVAEFIATLGASALITTLFLGGWRGPFLPDLVWFIAKMSLVIFVIVWIRASWPRLRVDQVLNLAWKGLFEMTLVSIVVTALMVTIFPNPTTGQLFIIALVNWGAFIVTMLVLSKVFKQKKISKNTKESGFSPYPVAQESQVL